MLTIGPGPDPYFAYKIHHVERAKTAWILSEEFGMYVRSAARRTDDHRASQSTDRPTEPTHGCAPSSQCLSGNFRHRGRPVPGTISTT